MLRDQRCLFEIFSSSCFEFVKNRIMIKKMLLLVPGNFALFIKELFSFDNINNILLSP